MAGVMSMPGPFVAPEDERPVRVHEPRFTRTALSVSAGVIVWSVHFAIVYAFNGLACARRFAGIEWFGAGVVTWVVGIATVAAMAIAAAMIVSRALRMAAESPFTDWLHAGLAAFALLAIGWEGLAVLIVPPCQ